MEIETGTARAGRRWRNGDRNGERGFGSDRGGQRGTGRKKESVGRGCFGVLGRLQGGRCRLGSAPITSVTVVTGDWNRRYGGCPRPTWTLESFKRKQ